MVSALVVAAVIYCTDVVDGMVARRLKVSSQIGYVLDGLGDRASYLAFWLVVVTQLGLLPVLAWLSVLRDFIWFSLRSLNARWYEISLSQRFHTKINAITLKLLIAVGLVLLPGLPWHSVLEDGFPHAVRATEYLLWMQVAYAYWLVVPGVKRFIMEREEA